MGIAGASMICAGLPLLIFAPVFLLMLYTTYLDVFVTLEVPVEESSNASDVQA